MRRWLLPLLLAISLLSGGIWASSVWAQPPTVGLAALSAGQYQQAEQLISAAIARGQQLKINYGNRCLAHLGLENYGAAIADCSRALEQEPQQIEVLLNRGLAYYRSGQATEAIADFEAILQQQQDYRALYNRGLAYLAIAQPQAAAADFEQVAPLIPAHNMLAHVELQTDLCMTELHLQQPEQALAACSQALKLQPTTTRARYLRALAQWQLHHSQAAILDLSQACRELEQAGDSEAWQRAQKLLWQWQQQSTAIANARILEQG